MIPARHLMLARLSAAAYLIAETDLRAAVAALGLTYKARIASGECVAVIIAEDLGEKFGEHPIVCFQGTRFAENTDLSEIWDDLDDGTIDLANKSDPFRGKVHAGFYRPLAALWPEIREALPDVSVPVTLTGHSLGGVRAHLAMGLCLDDGRACTAVSFGAPAGADEAYWEHPGIPPTRYVHGRDFAPAWPFQLIDREWVQPGRMMWLNHGLLVEVDRRPGLDLSVADHDIGAYIAAIEPFVAPDLGGVAEPVTAAVDMGVLA